MADSSERDVHGFPSPPAPLLSSKGEGYLDIEIGSGMAHHLASAPLPLRWERGRGEGSHGSGAAGESSLDVLAYAARIGYDGELTPTTATLRALHLAHLHTVPFENLDIHLGRPIVLDEELLFDKVVRRRRGGFCYELNGLFAALLRQIGFKVTLLGAQFVLPPEGNGPELDHLVLHVQSEDAAKPVLVDVAAGRGSFAVPLQSDTRRVQAQPEAGASFRLTPEDGGSRLWRRERGGDWERQYVFRWRTHQLPDFNEGCLYHQTSPESHFTQKRLCTRLTPEGRVTLSDWRLITTVDGARTEQDLENEAAYRQALWAHFGIDLDA